MIRKLPALLGLGFALCFLGAAVRAEAPHKPAPRATKSDPAHFRQVGEASWYGNGRRRVRRTSSGERFDPRRLTAAHATLPLQSEVLVTNLANGLTVRLIINDRLPLHGPRILDVSPIAAEMLDFKRKGVARVSIVLAPPGK